MIKRVTTLITPRIVIAEIIHLNNLSFILHKPNWIRVPATLLIKDNC